MASHTSRAAGAAIMAACLLVLAVATKTAAAADEAVTAPTACVASYAFAGPNHASGMATAMTRVARDLAAQGVPVTLVHTGPVRNGAGPEEWAAKYASSGLGYVNVLATPSAAPMTGSLAKTRSYRLFEWLSANADKCNVVHVHDYRGLAYYTVTAKAAGSEALRNTAVVIQGHGNTRMMHEANGVDRLTQEAMSDEAMEATAVALADVLTTPTEWYATWMREAGWKLPAATRVVPNMLPASLTGAAAGMCEGEGANAPARALAFFGRQTVLKGLMTFLDAAEELCPASNPGACAYEKVMFVGPAARLASGESSTSVIRRRCESLSVECEIVTSLSTTESAVAALAKARAVVVLPSNVETAGSALAECAVAGLPVLSSTAGGLPEMVAAGSNVFFAVGDVAALVSKAKAAAAAPCTFLAKPAANIAAASSLWASVHRESVGLTAARAPVAEVTAAVARSVPVSVAVVGSFDSAECLASVPRCDAALAGVGETLQSLTKQTQAAQEILVVLPVAGTDSMAMASVRAALATTAGARVVVVDSFALDEHMNA